MRRIAIEFISAITFLACASASAQIPLQWKTVALSGVDDQYGPQLGRGLTFRRIVDLDVNANNHLAFKAWLNNGETGIWLWDDSGNKRVVSDKADPQPGEFEDIRGSSIDDSDTIAVEQIKKPLPFSPTPKPEIWLHRNDEQVLAARLEDHDVTEYVRFRFTNGKIAFNGSIGDGPFGLYSAAENVVRPLALPGTDGPLGPGLGPGVSFDVTPFGDFRLDGAGDPLFHSSVSGAGFNRAGGIWRASQGIPRPIALVGASGNLGPNLGNNIVFSHLLGLPKTTDGIDIAIFEAGFAGPDTSGRGVFRSDFNSNTLIALADSDGPLGPQLGRDRMFGVPNPVSVNKRGDVLISSSLVGQTGPQLGLWLNSGNGNVPVMLTHTDGQFGPQLGPGFRFVTFQGTQHLDNAGIVIFAASVRGPEPDSPLQGGLWAWWNGKLLPLVQDGTYFAGRRVIGAWLAHFGDTDSIDRPSGSDGFVALQVWFERDETGIAVTYIPEPSTIALAGIAALALFAYHLRKTLAL